MSSPVSRGNTTFHQPNPPSSEQRVEMEKREEGVMQSQEMKRGATYSSSTSQHLHPITHILKSHLIPTRPIIHLSMSRSTLGGEVLVGE